MNKMNSEKDNLYNYYKDVLKGKGVRYYNENYNYIKKYKTNLINEEKVGISPPTGLTQPVLNSLLKNQILQFNAQEKEKGEKKNEFPKKKRKRIDNDLMNFLQK